MGNYADANVTKPVTFVRLAVDLLLKGAGDLIWLRVSVPCVTPNVVVAPLALLDSLYGVELVDAAAAFLFLAGVAVP